MTPILTIPGPLFIVVEIIGGLAIAIPAGFFVKKAYRAAKQRKDNYEKLKAFFEPKQHNEEVAK